MLFFDEILQNQKVFIVDGALGTELERRGFDIKDPLWSAKYLMHNSLAICEIHRDYLEAGADCITSASYQASFEGFMKRGMKEEEAKALIQSAVKIAIEVRDTFWENEANRLNRIKPFVAASVGPYGAYLADGSEFRGNYGLSEEALINFHRKRMCTLIEAKPDLIAFETIPCFIEAKAYVKLLAEFPQTQAWISFSAKDGQHINSGEKIATCASWLDEQEQILAIGINCTQPQYIVSLISEIRAVSRKPIIVYPNGGAQYDGVSKLWSSESTLSTYGDMARMWYENGATIIGGCCQTTPKDIEQIAKWVRA